MFYISLQKFSQTKSKLVLMNIAKANLGGLHLNPNTTSKMSSSNRIIIFLGSVRPGRMVERVSSALTRLVEQQGMDPLVFDPLNMPFEMVRIPLPFMSDPEKEAPEWLLEANNEIQNAAGFIVISAEYNCGVPPALANMLDHFSPDSFRHRPCGIVTYSMGPRGGIRAQVVLRPMLSELKMISTPYAVHLAEVHDAISEDGTIVTERIHNEFVRLVKEVEWYADAMRKQRECVAPPE